MFKRTTASSEAAAQRWAIGPYRQSQYRRLVTGAALLAALVVVLSFWAFRQIEDSVAARLHTYTLISKANALLSDITTRKPGSEAIR